MTNWPHGHAFGRSAGTTRVSRRRMNVPVDAWSISAYVLDGSGWRSTGDGVFTSMRSGCPQQGMVNVPTLQIGKGLFFCNHFVGIELTRNFCTHVRVFIELGNDGHIGY